MHLPTSCQGQLIAEGARLDLCMHFMYYHYHNDNATQNLKATMDKEKGMCKRPYSNHDDEYINILLQSFAQHVLLIADQDMEI